MRYRLWSVVLAAVLSLTAILALTPAAGATDTVAVAVADATVRSDQPSTNIGGADNNTVQASGPTRYTYLKFTISGIPAGNTVSAAQLRLRELFGATGFVNVRATGNAWDETALTWNARPAAGATITGKTLAPDAQTSFDVSSYVTGNGTYSFLLTTTSTTALRVGARENATASFRPQLAVTHAAPADTTPPSAPPNLTSSAADTPPSVTLNWGASTDNVGVTSYRVSRDGVVLSDLTAAARTYQDTAAASGQTYTYAVTAADAAGNRSAASTTTVTVPSPSPPPPPPPSDIYAEHVGFGNPAITGAQSIVVTSAADSGPGTLRAAAAGDLPKHVTFASDMVIENTSPIGIGSNTLVDGRGRNVVIDGTTTTDGVHIIGVAKVTLTHLTLRNFGDPALTGSNDPYDAVMVSGSADVWLDHLDLSGAGDKLVGVQDGSTGVTVSWSHFHDQAQVFQIGDQFGGEIVNSAQTVTVHHNYFDGTGYRHPVLSYGKAHVFNNYYRDWESYGARSQRVGRMHFEANVVFAVRDANITEFTTPGNGCNDIGTLCDDRDGYLTLAGNAVLPGSAPVVWKSNGTTFTPSAYYAYTPDPAGQALADAIVAGAGPN